MGYLTRYILSLISPHDRRDLFRSWLVDHCPVDFDILDGRECATWYTHDADIVAAMRATDVTSVLLHGIGAVAGNGWDKQFTRGADQTITIYSYRYSMVRDAEPNETQAFAPETTS